MDALELLTEHAQELRESFVPHVVLGNSTFGLTQYTFYMILVWIIVALIVCLVAKRLTLIPTNKFLNTVEYGYQFVRNDIGEGVIGHGFKKHVPFLATLFFFILVANFVGLIPGAGAATGAISVTWALATISFVYLNYWGINSHGGLGYIK